MTRQTALLPVTPDPCRRKALHLACLHLTPSFLVFFSLGDTLHWLTVMCSLRPHFFTLSPLPISPLAIAVVHEQRSPLAGGSPPRTISSGQYSRPASATGTAARSPPDAPLPEETPRQCFLGDKRSRRETKGAPKRAARNHL